MDFLCQVLYDIENESHWGLRENPNSRCFGAVDAVAGWPNVADVDRGTFARSAEWSVKDR